MKTILRILVILLVGVLVSSALYLSVENTSLLSDASGFPEDVTELGERPEMTTGDTGKLPERPEGDDDHHTASLSRGLSQVAESLIKIGIITLIVLAIQAIFTWLRRHLPIKTTLKA